MRSETTRCRSVMLGAAALLSAGVVASSLALDEDVWPAVTPEYSGHVIASCTNGACEIARMVPTNRWTQPVRSCVKTIDGVPTFCINDRPTFLLWGSAPSPVEGRPDPVIDVPYSMVTLSVYSFDYNPKTGVFDFGELNRRAERLSRMFPNSWFCVQFITFPPADWGKAHPDERVLDEKGERKLFWGGRVTDYSYASKAAAEMMGEQVKTMVAYLEKSPYANRIAAYRVASGDTIEWLGFPPKWKAAYDFSPVSRRRFKEWAKIHYPELGPDVEPPTFAARREQDNGGDLLWDRRKHLATTAFHEFYSEVNAEFLISVARAVRAAVGGRKAVGAYHGYTFFLNVFGDAQHRSHYAFKKVLDSGALDFVLSPQGYCLRRPGCAYADMKPFGSIRAHGILNVCENDLRTCHGPCLAEPNRFSQLPNEALSATSVRRDFAVETCRQNPLHHINISKTDFYLPSIERDLAAFRRLGDRLTAEGPSARRAEIALVVSEKSLVSQPVMSRAPANGEAWQVYETNGTVSVQTNLYRQIVFAETFIDQLDKWARVGAPVDYLLAEDLADHPGDYKLYVFLHDFVYDDALQAAVAKLRARGATMLWIYAPGWAKGATSSVANMRALTGISFARAAKPMRAGVTTAGDGRYMGLPRELVAPLFTVTGADEALGTYDDGSVGLAAFRQGKSLAFFSGTWQLDLSFIREVVRRAGVFTYVDTSDPVDANDRLFTLHARFAGKKTVRLPRPADVYDVFADKVVARGVREFTFDAPLHSTWLFELKPTASR